MAHHADCDGYRYAHARSIERNRTMRRAVCAECGPMLGWVGPAVTDSELGRMLACRSEWVDCDGRCLSWGENSGAGRTVAAK